MSDLLSSASLLMAAVTVLYSLWYPDLIKVLESTESSYNEDNVALCAMTKDVFLGKAILLTIMSSSVGVIFAPDALKICTQSLEIYQSSLNHSYDAIGTAYCFVFIFSCILAVNIFLLTQKIWKKWRRLMI
jgi:hypothetical protein